MKRNAVLIAFGVLVAVSTARNCWADTFIIPHIIEKSGRVSTLAQTWDTNIYATDTGRPAGAGDGQVDLYLYNFSGNALLSASATPVCAPCSFAFSETKKTFNISIDKLITAAGGFPSQALVFAWGAVVVQGTDPAKIKLESVTVKSNATVNELSYWSVTPQPPGLASRFIIPHIFEKPGRALTKANSTDTYLFMVNRSGAGNLPDEGSVEVALRLYDGDHLLKSKTGNVVCNPCSYVLDARKGARVDVEKWIKQAGGFPVGGVKNMWARLVGNTGFNVAGVTFTSHTAAGDLAFDGFVPQIAASPPVANSAPTAPPP